MAGEADDMKPGRWWRTLDAEGVLWSESSDEEENRRSLRKVPGGKLQRLYEVTYREWRDED